MKKNVSIIFFLLLCFPLYIFSQQAYKPGELLKFRVHYGILNAGYASMEVNEGTINNKKIYHVVGKGWSTGAVHAFFKVDDNYETFIDKNKGRPYRFIRQISEGGHTRDIQVDFDYDEKKAYVNDKKRKQNYTYTIPTDVQDMISAFYYFRNDLNGKTLVPGSEYRLNMFYGEETYDFKLKFLGREVITTKFGEISTLKFRPYVLAGRVFEEKESLTFWITDDKNKIPVKISAKLAVGSINASLEEFQGLKYPLHFIK